MPVKFSFDSGHCIKQRGGNYGLWEIAIKEKTGKNVSFSTDYAVYVSVGKYNELERELKRSMQDLGSQITKPLAEDFIEDALAAKEPLQLGGVVAYFLTLDREYELKHTGFVKSIKKVQEKSN